VQKKTPIELKEKVLSKSKKIIKMISEKIEFNLKNSIFFSIKLTEFTIFSNI
jgi:hypothetical protein